MSARSSAHQAYAVVKFTGADQDLYNARFDTADWSTADAQRIDRELQAFTRLSRSLDVATLVDELERLWSRRVMVSFGPIDPSRAWDELLADDSQSAGFAGRVGAQHTSTELETYYRFDVTSSPTQDAALTALHELVDLLNGVGGDVELAYVANDAARVTTDIAQPKAAGVSSKKISQSHFKSAQKAGMGIKYFQKRASTSSGQGVTFCDLEYGWILKNRDLPKIPKSALISGSNIHKSPVYPDTVNPNPEEKFNYSLHGLMVLGLVIAKPNGLDVTGIAPLARPLLASIYEYDKPTKTHKANMQSALSRAVSELNAGDVLLIEAQLAPPTEVGNLEKTPLNVPIEVNPLMRAAITDATNKGIIVIEAAGNNVPSGISLNDLTFPECPGWELDSDNRSPAIVVAAGSNATEIKYERAKASNYGAMVDCFADGDFIWVLNSEPLEYSGTWPPSFVVPGGGTSSASAIIAGVAIVLQSHAKSQKKLITPDLMREILRHPAYGTSSLYPNDEIGTMPDMKKIYNDLSYILASAVPWP